MARRVSSRVLVGRQQELALLHGALDRALTGSGGLVLVEGEAGIGKTRLVGEFVAQAEAAGVRVLSGECLPFAEAVPYAAVTELVRVAGEMSPGPEAAPDGGDRAPYFSWVAAGLSALAAQSPVLVVVEDLHWSDRSTGDLLLYLARSLRSARVLVVGSRRIGEPAAAGGTLADGLGELVRSGRADRIVLAALEPAEVIELLTELLGTAPGPELVERIAARAEGNPFFTEELVAAGAGEELPRTVRDLILERAGRLRPPSRELLRVLATIGRRTGDRLLREVAGGPDLDTALRDAVAHRILVVAGDGYAFRHALSHEAVYGELLPRERAELHERVATVLAARPDLAGGGGAAAQAELAMHWYAAGRLPQALAASVAAGRAADAGHAPAEAHVHYQRVLDLWAEVPDAAGVAGVGRPWLFEHAAHAAWVAGRHDEAVELNDRLLSELDPGRDPDEYALALDRQNRYLWYAGDREASNEVAVEIRRRIPSRLSPARARILCALAAETMLHGRLLEAVGQGHDALADAEEVGTPAEVAWARYVIGVTASRLGAHQEAGDQLEVALRLAEGNPNDPHSIAMTWYQRADAALLAGDPGTAVRIAEQGIAVVRTLGMERARQPLLSQPLLRALLVLGRWDDADRIGADPAGADADASFGYLPRVERSRLLARRGRFAEAASLQAGVDEHLTGNFPFRIAQVAAARAELALPQQDWQTARTAVRDGVDALADTDELAVLLDLVVLGIRTEADALGWARLNGAAAGLAAARATADDLLSLAAARLTRIEQAAGICSLPFRRTFDLARAERSRLDTTPSAQLWARIAGRAGQDSYAAAYARRRQAEALLGRQPEQAAAALREAHTAAVELDAVPLRDGIAELARRARIDLAGTDPASRP